MSVKHFISIIGLVGFMGLVVPVSAAAVVPQKSFIYRVKINQVNDKITFDNVSKRLETMFDNKIRFNDYTDEIIVRSDFDITQEQLRTNLETMGYRLQSYRQAYMLVPDKQ